MTRKFTTRSRHIQARDRVYVMNRRVRRQFGDYSTYLQSLTSLA